MNEIDIKQIHKRNIESGNYFDLQKNIINPADYGKYYIVVVSYDDKYFKSMSLAFFDINNIDEVVPKRIKDAIELVEKIGDLCVYIQKEVMDKLLQKFDNKYFYYDMNNGRHYFNFLNTKIEIY